MKKEGNIIIQHGDFPHDFKDVHRETIDFIKGVIEEVSHEAREITREPDDCYLEDTTKIIGSFKKDRRIPAP